LAALPNSGFSLERLDCTEFDLEKTRYLDRSSKNDLEGFAYSKS